MGEQSVAVLLIIVVLGYCKAEFTPINKFLINCGSVADVTVGKRVFTADNSQLAILTSPQSIPANTSINSVPASIDNAVLYQTAMILAEPSSYSFKITSHSRHFVRLHFFPFRYQSYDLAAAIFKVSTQDDVLLDSFTPANISAPEFMEYSLNITRDMLILTFVPQEESIAFINAIEVISVPGQITEPMEAEIAFAYHNFAKYPWLTVYRINVGGPKVTVDDDMLWRTWDTDQSFFLNSTTTQLVTYQGKLNYRQGAATEEDAPDSVYNTARRLVGENNMTWQFNVDGRSRYLIRFHFCDLVSETTNSLYFDVYLDRMSVATNVALSSKVSGFLNVPYYMDYFLSSSDPSGKLSVSIGPSSLKNVKPDGILNGLEIMKICPGPAEVVEPSCAGYYHTESEKCSKKRKRKQIVILGSVLGGVGLIIIGGILCFVIRRKKKKKPQPSSTSLPSSSWIPLTVNGPSSDANHRFPFIVLQEATNNFDDQMVIGSGGFGKVYKAVLPGDSKIVAVKRGNKQSRQGITEFHTEIELLSGLRHRHLVSLIGYCDDSNEMLLVYEYVEKGTLKSHLYGSGLPTLGWKKRLEICIGAARGIHYLHTGLVKTIIHRDIKTASILLGENLVAKVSDFGISKLGPSADQTHVTTLVKGSFGYLDPEYYRRQRLTEKSDVYAFGVVMLEVLCGRAAVDTSFEDEELISLPEWATKCQKQGRLHEIVDKQIAGRIKAKCLRLYGELVGRCLSEKGVNRPAMGEVLWSLECILQLQEAVAETSHTHRCGGGDYVRAELQVR